MCSAWRSPASAAACMSSRGDARLKLLTFSSQSLHSQPSAQMQLPVSAATEAPNESLLASASSGSVGDGECSAEQSSGSPFARVRAQSSQSWRRTLVSSFRRLARERCQRRFGTRVLRQQPAVSAPSLDGSISHTGRAQMRQLCLERRGAAFRTKEERLSEEPQGVKGSVHRAQQSLALPLLG